MPYWQKQQISEESWCTNTDGHKKDKVIIPKQAIKTSKSYSFINLNISSNENFKIQFINDDNHCVYDCSGWNY